MKINSTMQPTESVWQTDPQVHFKIMGDSQILESKSFTSYHILKYQQDLHKGFSNAK